MAKIIVKGVVIGSSDANPVTKETIASALGYTPADSDQVEKNTSDIARILTEGVGSGIRCLDCATFLLLYSEDRLVEDVKYEVNCTEEEMTDIINKINSADYDFTSYNVQFIVDDEGGEIGESATTTPRYGIKRGTSITVDNGYDYAIISCYLGTTSITVADRDGNTSTLSISDSTIIEFTEPVTFTSDLEIEVLYPSNDIAYLILKKLINAGSGNLTAASYAQITELVNTNGIYSDAEIPVEPEEDEETDSDNMFEDYEGDATDEEILAIFK